MTLLKHYERENYNCIDFAFSGGKGRVAIDKKGNIHLSKIEDLPMHEFNQLLFFINDLDQQVQERFNENRE